MVYKAIVHTHAAFSLHTIRTAKHQSSAHGHAFTKQRRSVRTYANIYKTPTMTTLLVIFTTSLVLSLFLTPIAGWAGKNFGILDIPNERKVHSTPIPRTGGLAIFASFIMTMVFCNTFSTTITDQLVINRQMLFFLTGGVIVFGIGVADDFLQLGPKIKCVFQIVAASIAFYGGLRIEAFTILGYTLSFGFVGYLVTVFWFLLFINAINLADGLDGLSAGIVFFASMVMVVLLILREQYFTAMLAAALGGTTLGFLRYNFNPASIFMGDSGSYFLGYTLAGLSIIGTFKSQIGAVMLIPVVALGVPLFDTMLAPIRRFIIGRKMFQPDKEHIHHRLLSMGLSTRKVVWVLYIATMALCLMSIILVNIRDEQAGLVLIILGACAFIVVRKLGYFEYFAVDTVREWFRDLSDELGLSIERRDFLNYQIGIGDSSTIEDLWDAACRAIERMAFDMAEINIESFETAAGKVNGLKKSWIRTELKSYSFDTSLLKLELPLLDKNNSHMGTVCLYKDLQRSAMNDFTLRRVELLRRTIIRTLETIKHTPSQN